eukprot:scaffold10472_cov126-Cylindrotheca_fusiformis.AAC.2
MLCRFQTERGATVVACRRAKVRLACVEHGSRRCRMAVPMLVHATNPGLILQLAIMERSRHKVIPTL